MAGETNTIVFFIRTFRGMPVPFASRPEFDAAVQTCMKYSEIARSALGFNPSLLECTPVNASRYLGTDKERKVLFEALLTQLAKAQAYLGPDPVVLRCTILGARGCEMLYPGRTSAEEAANCMRELIPTANTVIFTPDSADLMSAYIPTYAEGAKKFDYNIDAFRAAEALAKKSGF